jgi:putative copper export protein
MLRVLSIDLGVIRVFLHVLAATVWVGGQLTLAALVPVLRRTGPDAARNAARAFNRVAWPAFAVLVATGIWNVLAIGAAGAEYRTTLVVKLVLVVVSGGTAFLHARARSRTGLAVFGALTGLSALGALLVGVLLAG